MRLACRSALMASARRRREAEAARLASQKLPVPAPTIDPRRQTLEQEIAAEEQRLTALREQLKNLSMDSAGL